MANKKDCSHCKNTGEHLCPDVVEPVVVKCCGKGCQHRSDGDFATSAVIGAVTDSAILGGLLGGDLVGGILGDLFDGDLDD